MKTILITGGTRGIGRSVANRFATGGYNLILTYSKDHDAAYQAATEIANKHGVTVKTFAADLSDRAAIDTIATFVKSRTTALSGVIFNAGTTDRTTFPQIEADGWNAVMQSNVNFPVLFLEAIDSLLEKNAFVIFTGSAMGIFPHSVSLAYGVTKAAVHALVENLVKFYTTRSIRVNAIAPGFVDTEWQKEKPANIRQSIESKIALGAFCNPNDLADLYWSVAHNNYMNGSIVRIDGGYCFR